MADSGLWSRWLGVWKAVDHAEGLSPEFRARAVALVRAGKPVREAVRELGISESCLHNWVKQDRIDRGGRAGLSSKEHADLVAAKRRIRQLETELEVLREASEIYEELKGDPKGRSR